MPACPYCSSSDLTRDGHDQRGRVVRACRACGRHATSESTSLVAGHRFPRDIILLAVRYYLQLGAAAERIAGILADRGIDVSGRTILRWVQKFGPALSAEIRRCRKLLSTIWLVDETYLPGAQRRQHRAAGQEPRSPGAESSAAALARSWTARSCCCGFGRRRARPCGSRVGRRGQRCGDRPGDRDRNQRLLACAFGAPAAV